MAIGGAPFLAPTLPHGPPTEEKNAGAGLTPRAVGGRNAAPPIQPRGMCGPNGADLSVTAGGAKRNPRNTRIPRV